MTTEGPPLDRLLHRMLACPPEFLMEPRLGMADGIDVAAVVSDHFRWLASDPRSGPCNEAFGPLAVSLRKAGSANWLTTVCVATWLLHDEWFRDHPELADAAWRLLSQALRPLAAAVPAASLISDPDRREELVRLCLHHLGLRPEGETEQQAADRLTMLDSVERVAVLRATRESEKRAQAVREAMAKKAAEAAAAKASRE